MLCNKCKKEVPDGIKFCPFCGSKQEIRRVREEKAFVPARGEDDKTVVLIEETRYVTVENTVDAQTETRYPFAGSYYPQINPVPQNNYAAPIQPTPAAEPPKKKKSVLGIIIPIVFAVLILIAIVVFGILFAILNKDDEKPEYITYLASHELYYAEKDNLKKPVKIADIEYDDESYYYIVENTVIRDNKVFFVQDVEYNGGSPTFSIYMKNINKNSEPVMIADDVDSCYFAVDPEGDKVVYGKDSVAYYSDLEMTYQLAGNVVGWCVDDNVENIMFLRDDGEEMALCSAEITKNASAEILVSGITLLHSINDEMNVAVYVKNDALYIYKNGEERLIDENVDDVYGGDSDKFYYVALSEEGVSKSLYFNDDLASGDANITEPDINNYTEYYYGFSYTNPEYYTALEQYEYKQNRDEVRAMAEIPLTSYDLYYYDGVTESLVCEDVDTHNVFYDESRIVFNIYDPVKANKFNMSDMTVAEEFESLLLDARNETLTTCFASGSKIAREITFTQPSAFEFTDDAVYYLDNHIYFGDSYISKGDLKKITVASDGTVTSSLIELEVNHYTVLGDSGEIGYFKEINNNTCGKFYVDGVLIENDALMHYVNYTDGKYYLIRNYDFSSNKGELCMIENGETTVLADSVSGYNMRMKDYIFFTSNLKSDSDYNYTFDINYYDGDDCVQMATGVTTWNLIPDYFLECDKDTMILVTGYRYYYTEE